MSYSGSGTLQDPFIITTTQELYNMRYYPGDVNTTIHWKLGNDIDLSSWHTASGSWVPIRSGSDIPNDIDSYYVNLTFDGAGYTISNMYISESYSSESIHGIGLFGNIYYIGENTSSYIIKDLTLNSCSIELRDFNFSWYPPSQIIAIGLLAGVVNDYNNNNSSSIAQYNYITNVHIKNSSIVIIKSDATSSQQELNEINVAGIIGKFDAGRISSCSVNNLNIYMNVTKSQA